MGQVQGSPQPTTRPYIVLDRYGRPLSGKVRVGGSAVQASSRADELAAFEQFKKLEVDMDTVAKGDLENNGRGLIEALLRRWTSFIDVLAKKEQEGKNYFSSKQIDGLQKRSLEIEEGLLYLFKQYFAIRLMKTATSSDLPGKYRVSKEDIDRVFTGYENEFKGLRELRTYLEWTNKLQKAPFEAAIENYLRGNEVQEAVSYYQRLARLASVSAKNNLKDFSVILTYLVDFRDVLKSIKDSNLRTSQRNVLNKLVQEVATKALIAVINWGYGQYQDDGTPEGTDTVVRSLENVDFPILGEFQKYNVGLDHETLVRNLQAKIALTKEDLAKKQAEETARLAKQVADEEKAKAAKLEAEAKLKASEQLARAAVLQREAALAAERARKEAEKAAADLARSRELEREATRKEAEQRLADIAKERQAELSSRQSEAIRKATEASTKYVLEQERPSTKTTTKTTGGKKSEGCEKRSHLKCPTDATEFLQGPRCGFYYLKTNQKGRQVKQYCRPPADASVTLDEKAEMKRTELARLKDEAKALKIRLPKNVTSTWLRAKIAEKQSS